MVASHESTSLSLSALVRWRECHTFIIGSERKESRNKIWKPTPALGCSQPIKPSDVSTIQRNILTGRIMNVNALDHSNSIRSASEKDLDEVMEVERLSFSAP